MAGKIKLHADGCYDCGDYASVEGDVFTFTGGPMLRGLRPGVVKILKPMDSSLNYFEYKIIGGGTEPAAGIGVGELQYPLNRMPGWNRNGIGYHSDDGKLYYQRGHGEDHGPTCSVGDRMGCGIDFAESEISDVVNVFFTKNGQLVGDFIRMKKPDGGLYALIGMCHDKDQVQYLGHWKYLPKGITQATKGIKLHADSCYRCGNNAEVEGDLFKYRGGPRLGMKKTGAIKIMEPMNVSLNYFEIQIVSGGVEGEIGIGMGEFEYPVDQMPGWYHNGIGYHADNGKLYHQRGIGQTFGPTCTVGDRMGCGVDFENEASSGYVNVFFTKNGEQVGDLVRMKKPLSGLYSVIGLCSEGEAVQYLGHWHYLPEGGISSKDSSANRVQKYDQYECATYTKVEGDLFSYTGRNSTGYSKKAGIVKLKNRMNPELNYFEYQITKPGQRCEIGIGLGEAEYPLDHMPGWTKNGIGYHADDGHVYYQHGYGRKFGPTCNVGDRMGCGVDFESEDSSGYLNVFFTKNGEKVGDFVQIKKPVSGLYPLIGLCSEGEQVRYLGHWHHLPQSNVQKNESSEVPPLTLENIIQYLKDLSVIWYIIGFNLNMPISKLDDIEDAINFDEEGLTLMVREWLQSEGRRTWRDILWAICRIMEKLDGKSMESEVDLATAKCIQSVCNRVMSYAEPMEDKTLTVENICTVLSAVSENDWKKVWSWGALLFNFQIKYNAYGATSPLHGHQICARDYIKYNPKASWQHLSRVLYFWEETAAVKMLKHYLPLKDEKLTIENLKEAMKDVKESEWDDIGRRFRLPESKRLHISSTCRTDAEKKASVIRCYVDDHPSPSWENVATILRALNYDKEAREVTAKYLSGGGHVPSSAGGVAKPNKPLTLENVLECVNSISKKWHKLGSCLGIPRSKLASINSESDGEGLAAIIKEWLAGAGTPPTWRCLFWVLCRMEEMDIADKMEDYVEPIKDPSLTVENVYQAVSVITDIGWRDVWKWGGMLQASMLDKLEELLLPAEEAHRTCATLYIRYNPKASWQHLSRILYQKKQDQALGMVKPHLPPKEATLTIQNLQEIFKDVDEEKWDLIGRKLRLPESKRDEIKSDYESDSERKAAILTSYATEHPYPNWLHVADLLRGLDCVKQANLISVKYLSQKTELTVENVMPCIKCLIPVWDHLGYYNLEIPSSVINEIRSNATTPEEALTAVIKKWIEGAGNPPSWRRLVWELFGIDATVAGTIKSFAEPIQESTLTTVNVCAATSLVAVTNTRVIWSSAGISDSVLDDIGEKASSLKECNCLAAAHYINYSPKASWNHISGVLYSYGEFAAVEKMKPFIPPKDDTLTYDNLKKALKELPDSRWNEIALTFRFPDSEIHEVQSRYPTDAKRKQAVLEKYANKHPCPSWMHITRVLRGMEYHKLAKEITQHYLSGGVDVPEEEETVKALPLTLENVMESIKDVSDKWIVLCNRLGFSESKEASIRRSSSSDEDALTRVVKEWLKGEGHPANWRRLIDALYQIKEADTADKLIGNAEPDLDQDPTLTVENVLAVMTLVDKPWKTAWLRMSLPIAFLNSTQGSGLSDKEAHNKCASFYVRCFPNASWQHLSGRLYQYGEETALEKLKPYLPSKDPSLTFDNLSAVFENIPANEWEDAGLRFRIPESERDMIKSTYQTDDQRKEAILETYIDKHPCPSWQHVTRILRGMQFPNLSKEVAKKYLTAPPLTQSNIMTYIKSLSSVWFEFGLQISISESDLKGVRNSARSEEEALESVVKLWLQGKGVTVRWRELIWPLYENGANSAAEKVKTFSMPVKDQTLTVENVCSAMYYVNNWREAWQWVGLPDNQLDATEEIVSSLEQWHRSCASAYINYYPYPSWQHLSGRLFQAEEIAAIEKLKPFLPPRDPTLTLENLNEVFNSVPDEKWNDAYQVLRIPLSLMSLIVQHYGSDHEIKLAVIECYYSKHPCPSWEHVARVLRGIGEVSLSDMVKSKYISVKRKKRPSMDESSPTSPTAGIDEDPLTATLKISSDVMKEVSKCGDDHNETQVISVTKKAKKDKFANTFIGEASDLGHLSQLGYDSVTGEFDVSKVSPLWKKALDSLGLTEKHLENRDCAAFIYEYVMRHGGIKQFEANQPLEKEGETKKEEPIPPAAPTTSSSHDNVDGDVSVPPTKSPATQKSPSSPTLPDEDYDSDEDQHELITDKTVDPNDSMNWTHSKSFKEPPEQPKQQPETLSDEQRINTMIKNQLPILLVEYMEKKTSATCTPAQASTKSPKLFPTEKEEPKANEGASASNKSNTCFTEKPKLKELHFFTWTCTTDGRTKKTRVIKTTCDKWKMLGDILGVIPGYLNSLYKKHMGDAEETCRDIFCEWLEKGDVDSNYKKSWVGVIKLLDDCDICALAEELKEALPKKENDE